MITPYGCLTIDCWSLSPLIDHSRASLSWMVSRSHHLLALLSIGCPQIIHYEPFTPINQPFLGAAYFEKSLSWITSMYSTLIGPPFAHRLTIAWGDMPETRCYSPAAQHRPAPQRQLVEFGVVPALSASNSVPHICHTPGAQVEDLSTWKLLSG